jgi:hypothetical protein
MIRPKSQNFKIGHDAILSIGNFILMIKNNILLFQLPETYQQPKNVLPISVATRNFLFICNTQGLPFLSRNLYGWYPLEFAVLSLVPKVVTEIAVRLF